MSAKSSGGTQHSAHRSTDMSGRALAPDLARGSALLGIALANSVYYIDAEEYGARSRPTDGTALDSAVDLLLVSLVDARWLPLFAALFGYGAVQLARRLASAGHVPAAVRRVQRRRFTWLAAFGAAHVLLLFGGDILAIYGLLGFLVLFLLWASDRLLLIVAGATTAVAGVLSSATGLPPVGGYGRMSIPSLLVADQWDALVLRVASWPVDFALLSWAAFAPMLFGVWAARRRLLEEPWRHVPVLRRTAMVGIPVGVIGGLPLGLIASGVWSAEFSVTALTSMLHVLTGFAGALGVGAAFGLVSARKRDGHGPVTHALVATGRRSLSCYLAQSVALVCLFAPYGGGLGTEVGTAAMAAVAVAIWFTTVVLASLADRFDLPGPAETLLRRLTRPGVFRQRSANAIKEFRRGR